MLRRFLTLAIRNLLKQKQTTLISIAGLVIALSVAIQIVRWCSFEMSYDKWNSKADRIYRFSVEESKPQENFYRNSAYSWQPWLSELPDYYPEVESLVELRPMLFTIVRKSNNIFRTNKAFAIDRSIFDVFDFDFIEGSASTALLSKNTVAVSESFAKRLFPGQDALSKIFEFKSGNMSDYEMCTIVAVYKDLPANSHFHPEVLAYCDKKPLGRNDIAYVYLLLKKGSTIGQIESRENDFVKKYVPENKQQSFKINNICLTDIHLKSNFTDEIEPGGNIRQVRLFIFIGLGILFIALINYINFLLAAFEKRNKYYHINITIGARQWHNVLLLFFESLSVVFVVFWISAVLFRPLSKILVSSGILNGFSLYLNPWMVGITLIYLLLVVLSGVFPVFLIKMKPSVFFSHKSSVFLNGKTSYVNNMLLVLQFSVSIVVLTCALMLSRQNQFLFSRNIGGGNPNIVVLSREFQANSAQTKLLKEQLLKTPAVEGVSMCMLRPGDLVKGFDGVEYADIPKENKNLRLTILPVGDNFFSFFDIPFIAGSEGKYENDQDQGNYILNEAAVKKLGFESSEKAIGTSFKMGNIGPTTIRGGVITGVVKDFNFASLYNPIEPTVFFHNPSWQCQLFVKLAPGNTNKNIAGLKHAWDKVFPDYPFDCQFLDDVYNKHYQKDIVTSKLVNWFTIVCMVLSSIGLLGITSILVIRKTKEIGIRKVNGAKISDVLVMLNKDFVKWVAIAFVVATPVAWYAMHKWLENFAYKTELNWWIFALAGLLALFIALLTVSFQSWQTATRNPVESLRDE